MLRWAASGKTGSINQELFYHQKSTSIEGIIFSDEIINTRSKVCFVSNFICSTSWPLARVLAGFDQRYRASAVHLSTQRRRWLTSATSRIQKIFLGMPGIEPGADRCEARMHSIVLCGPPALYQTLNDLEAWWHSAGGKELNQLCTRQLATRSTVAMIDIFCAKNRLAFYFRPKKKSGGDLLLDQTSLFRLRDPTITTTATTTTAAARTTTATATPTTPKHQQHQKQQKQQQQHQRIIKTGNNTSNSSGIISSGNSHNNSDNINKNNNNSIKNIEKYQELQQQQHQQQQQQL